MERGATFDRSTQYRYSLWRVWQPDLPAIAFIMLNPSRADAEVDDPTIRRCLGLAKGWGFGSLITVNLFARIATHPQDLLKVTDPVGKECDRYILEAVSRSQQTILAWGNGGRLQGRDRSVLQLLGAGSDREQTALYCLGINQTGQPRHPLYLPRQTQPTLISSIS